MDLDFQFFGAKEMEQVFRALPDRMQSNVITSAVRAGATIVKKAAQQNLTQSGAIRTGLLRYSINTKIKNYKRDGVVYGAVGPRYDVVGTTERGKTIRPANYSHLIENEYGSLSYRAKPFLRPAIDQSQAAVFSAITKKARTGLAREIKKLRKATR